MFAKCQMGLIVATGLAISGCQNQPIAERRAEPKPIKVTSDRSTKPTTERDQSLTSKPVYIDLGPIETVTLSPSPTVYAAQPVVVVPNDNARALPFNPALSPADSVQAQQLNLSSSPASNLRVEQPVGPFNDRCDPVYWGGAQPPASLGCDRVVQGFTDKEPQQAPRPGTYVRLNQKSSLRLDDAALIVRKVGGPKVEIHDDALGAILVIGGSGAPVRKRPERLPGDDAPLVDDAVSVNGHATAPPVLLP